MHLLSYETICYQAQISYKDAIYQHLATSIRRLVPERSTTIRRLFAERSTNYLLMVNKIGKDADHSRENADKDRKNVDINSTGEVTYQSTPQYGLVEVNNHCKLQDLAQEAADEGQTSGRP